MSITSRRSVREKVAATAAARPRARRRTRTSTPSRRLGRRASGSRLRSVPTPSPRPSPCRRRRRTDRTRSTGSSPATNASTTRAVWSAVVSVGSGVAPSNGSTTRIGGSKPASRTSRSPMGSAAVEIRASGATRREPLQRPPRPVRRSRLGAARDRLRHLPSVPFEPDAAAHPGDRVHHESDVHVRSFGGEPLSGRRLAAGRSRLRRPQNKREP